MITTLGVHTNASDTGGFFFPEPIEASTTINVHHNQMDKVLRVIVAQN